MNNELNTKTDNHESESKFGLPQDPVVASRRRLLLQGIIKSSAVAASVVPIKSMATAPLITNENPAYVCSVSGHYSIAHSRMTAPKVCGGYSCSHYKTIINWPNCNNSNPRVATNYVNGIKFTQNSSFKAVFGSGSSSSLITILNNNTSHEYAYWITALLNSIKPQGIYVYTHDASQVRALYNSDQRAAAYSFFKSKLSWRA